MTSSFPPIFVLRHGETVWNTEGRLQGHLDSPLTARGVEHAKAQHAILRRHLPSGAQAVVSDSGRSRDTARLALGALDVPQSIDPRLREVALGQWQGLTLEDIEARWGWLVEDRDPFDWKFDAPGGESLSALTDRCRAVLAGLTGPTVLVTHGLTSRVLRSLALGRRVEDLGALPGGQGIVHLVADGKAQVLTA